MTKLFAVIGNPIEQSRSPELHHDFAKQLDISLHYKKILAPLDGFNNAVNDFFQHDGVGMNVTVPFKEQAFELCDQLTERAKIAKAVNTLWQVDGKLYGDNTDGQGLVDAILALNWPLQGSKVLILGAGGATRGVIYPLFQAGVEEIVIANRTLERAERLVDDLSQSLANSKHHAALSALPVDQLAGDFDLIINATSASLTGEALTLPSQLHFNYAYEMAYGKPSSFIEQAKQRGVPYTDGFGMLIGQAIEAFNIWHGKKPNIKDFLKDSA